MNSILNPRGHAVWINALVLLTIFLVSALNLAHAGPPRVYAWGDNFYGQTNVPAVLTNVTSIAAGYYHALALRSNGTVVSWGQNLYGQTNNQPTLTNVLAIAGGGYHSLALRSNGTVYGWGLNSQGQRTIPPTATGVKAISAGNSHSLALRTNGLVIAWGGNASGQTDIPPGLSNVVAISAGDNHCLALRNNGTVVGWGEDFSGQATVPSNITNIMAIAAGYHHNLVIRSNGTVAAWGVNVYGETSVPPGLSNVIAVVAGYFWSAALRNDGTVVAWGQDFSGVTNVPVGLNSVTAIAGNWELGLALSTAPLCPPGFPDLFECRQVITGSALTNVISNVGATREPGEPSHGGANSSNSLWYSWTAPASGGVAIEATTTDFDFASPLLAVYTGSSLTSLTNLAYNFAPFNGNGSPLNKARVQFTAVSNQTYQIAVDAAPNTSSQTEGLITFKLTLSPPPVNDLFQNATPITGLFYEITNATFRGANRETGEPTHGTNYAQTLWWTWMAPTNLGVSSIPVRLSGDAASHPPALGAYTGNSVSTLTPVSGFVSVADGMSRTATFTAIPGVTYRFAVAGLQNDVESVLPIIGNFRFRFNTRALGITINNVISNSVSSTQPVSFSATANITNLGSATSGPLRILLTAVPGISMRGPDVLLIDVSAQVLTNYPKAPLPPGQFTNFPVAGVAPPPSEYPPGTRAAEGFGVHAELQEQADTNWITVDETLVLYGNWPVLEGLPGPGGGVIRLDPAFIGGSAFNPLQSVTVIGPPTVIEGTPTAYIGRAVYFNGVQYNFTNTVWLSALPFITNGWFKPGIIQNNTNVTLAAQFSNSGFLFSATSNVLVINLPSPFLSQPAKIGGNFILQIQGVSNRVHVIEAATNLASPTVWLPLGTNTIGASGLWNFTNTIGATPQRFYRGREVE